MRDRDPTRTLPLAGRVSCFSGHDRYGNLAEMFKNLRAADDLEFRYGINAPTVRVEGMTVAGA
ncbi:MAG TPA: metallopeptidase TldD-related protein [Candidatus Limnocylindrales bacterium]|nr:metallopeptidase TldD-related protein [Candidatus Limnocylindrales bacterium]